MSQQLLTLLMTHAGEAEVRPSGGRVSGGAAGFTRGGRSSARHSGDNPPGWMRASGRRLNWRLQFWTLGKKKKRREKASVWASEMAAVQESGEGARVDQDVCLSVCLSALNLCSFPSRENILDSEHSDVIFEHQAVLQRYRTAGPEQRRGDGGGR